MAKMLVGFVVVAVGTAVLLPATVLALTVLVATEAQQSCDVAGAAGPGQQSAGVPPPFAATVARAAATHRVPAPLLAGLLRAESGWDVDARSPSGAIGVAQLMPGTATALGVDPTDPYQSIDGAARYLSEQLRAFGSTELAVAAYNAGPGAVAAHGRVPPFDETRAYVPRVLGFAAEAATGIALPSDRVGAPAPRSGAAPAPTGRMVAVAGQPGTTVDASIASQVAWMAATYKLDLGDGYAPTGHQPDGEHPLGLAFDATPDFAAGGSWELVDRLALALEPVPDDPISMYRWIGYDGDAGHGRGNHLHVSFSRTGGTVLPAAAELVATARPPLLPQPGACPPSTSPALDPVPPRMGQSGGYGFAATVTGGAGGPGCAVTTLADSGPGSLRECAERPGPLRVSAAVTGTIRLSGDIEVASDKTLDGAGGLTLSGGGLLVRDQRNVEITGFTFGPTGSGTSDQVAARRNFDDVYVHHNTFTPTEDGSIDITETLGVPGEHDLTASWNHFSSTNKTMLVNPSPAQDVSAFDPKLRVTVNHNWFDRTVARPPRLLQGLGDVTNNLYTDSGFIDIGAGARATVEGNAFEGGATPVRTTGDARHGPGVAQVAGNVGAGVTEAGQPTPVTRPAYRRKVQPAAQVAGIVRARAGARAGGAEAPG